MASKVNLLFISILLLSLLLTSIVAWKREFPETSPKKSDQAQMNGLGEADRVVNEDSIKCNDGDDEDEECLMRRTLAAHVDYIYTQKEKKP